MTRLPDQTRPQEREEGVGTEGGRVSAKDCAVVRIRECSMGAAEREMRVTEKGKEDKHG